MMLAGAVWHYACVVAMTPWPKGLTWQRPGLLLALPVALLPLWFSRRHHELPPLRLPTASLLEQLPVHRRPSSDQLLTAVRMVLLALLVLACAGPERAVSTTTERADAQTSASVTQSTAVGPQGQGGNHIIIVGPASVSGQLTVADMLARALAPLGDEAGPWHIRRACAGTVDAASLTEASQLWLADVDAAAIDSTVVDFVAAGGSVLVTPGFGDGLTARKDEFWPLHLTAPRSADAPWPQVSPTPPPGSAIAPELASALAQVVVRPRYQVRLSDGATIHLALADGKPALVERIFGRGRVAVLALDLSLHGHDGGDASDLGRRGVFVWLVQTLAEHLQTSAQEPTVNMPTGNTIADTASQRNLPLTAMLLIAVWLAWAIEQVILTWRRGTSGTRAGAQP